MKRLICVVLLFALAMPVVSATSDGSSGGVYTYLVAGLDEVAGNTDSIILINYDITSNRATLLQIPRDTACLYDGIEIRINSILPREIAKGEDTDTALLELQSFISTRLAIEIDGYLGLKTSAFRRFVDNLGGVDIYLDRDISFDDGEGNKLEYNKGTTRLDGREAEYFVRYRKGYLTGDVGRVDMQKIFLSGLVNRFKSGLSLGVLYKLLRDDGDGVYTNIKTTDIIGFLMKNRGRIKLVESFFATMPGEAVVSSNHGWVYAINKKASELLLYEQGFLANGVFDSGLELLINDSSVKESYFNENIDWHKFIETDTNNITVK